MPDEVENDAPWLVIGLGNPGPDYEWTYHNVGFRVVEALAERRGAPLRLRIGAARVARLGQTPEIVLVQPLTYMNRSGQVLGTLFEKFGSDARLLVVSDDLALPIGKVRIRERGSAGGHNGLRSISSAYGSDDYLRVRVGIMPARGIDDGKEFVLSEVTVTDRATLRRAERLAADAVEHVTREGARSAMSKYNGLHLGEDGRDDASDE